ncbi:hypothetical protein A3J20_06495 [Candidatus Gottesmanbacteria bacterium RIFCSPLOWO2_02_FULL_42_29]|uniref:Uncharacterized protein n=2 Tax=Candidatus Gottesmaniibacteriota TaxID=1752720 RepID=A0A1F6BJM7_9BACT|nr:MAG: hypothetical protein UV09_C0012G0033 [Candidatus Gottesmanbacteria bacterium GW2011_GWA2_42_18]KKS76436.1 MAG: hypothetical protein UV46_C0002G0020 [Candidatus Gottesmanbacteria bacterium GW2011_GWC2_42_8]OGG10958.1 MAG: hypothetical protein A2781_01240 [Candidatus Gottesmanbacteria bacterium RIFCSPHIGHO2_01_FULL_42_27]OGG22257.1 MAG: hypothetical protein A3E72_03055 [Candidatus Gottesmanbacteria bacterium RIFCSPHIGHO2_12_FULL_43_26]OGG33201.1 MAG: hypothetical protein A3G68_07155 [Cand
MQISLKSLLLAANYPEEEVGLLLSKEEFLTDEEKFKLTETAWYLISQKYISMQNLHNTQVWREIGEGKRKYNKNDFEEIKARLIHEIIEKLEITNEQTLIDEVRQKLEKFKTEKANS